MDKEEGQPTLSGRRGVIGETGTGNDAIPERGIKNRNGLSKERAPTEIGHFVLDQRPNK